MAVQSDQASLLRLVGDLSVFSKVLFRLCLICVNLRHLRFTR